MSDDYQLFLFNAADHLARGLVTACVGDAEAMKIAGRRLARDEAVEVWLSGRLVGRLPRPS